MLKKFVWVVLALVALAVLLGKKEHRRAAHEAQLWAEASDQVPLT